MVVIPLMGGEAENLQNIITVSKENGDFISPVDAVNSIPTTGVDAPSRFNPYLIVIGPGDYTIGQEQLVMKQWVSIAGSGQNATYIRGSAGTTELDSSSAVVVGASNATLSDLSIQNANSTQRAIAIFNDGASPRIERVTAQAVGTGVNYGIYNTNSSAPVITNAKILCNSSAAALNYGVFNHSSSPVMANVEIGAFSGQSGNIGLYLESGSKPRIRGSIISSLYMPSDSRYTQITNSKIATIIADNSIYRECFGNFSSNLAPVDC